MGDDQRLLLQRNISAASQVGRKPPSSAARVIRVSGPDTHTVHNYSIQTLNSVELAKKELYWEMAKVSDSTGPGAAQRAHCGQADGGRPSGLLLLTPWPAVSGDLGAGERPCISGLSILFHWSIFLSLCQYHSVLITVAL